MSSAGIAVMIQVSMIRLTTRTTAHPDTQTLVWKKRILHSAQYFSENPARRTDKRKNTLAKTRELVSEVVSGSALLLQRGCARLSPIPISGSAVAIARCDWLKPKATVFLFAFVQHVHDEAAVRFSGTEEECGEVAVLVVRCVVCVYGGGGMGRACNHLVLVQAVLCCSRLAVVCQHWWLSSVRSSPKLRRLETLR